MLSPTPLHPTAQRPNALNPQTIIKLRTAYTVKSLELHNRGMKTMVCEPAGPRDVIQYRDVDTWQTRTFGSDATTLRVKK